MPGSLPGDRVVGEIWVAGPFLASLILLGMPHGAIDHILYFRHYRTSVTPLRLTAFILVYLGIAGAMAGLWVAFPVVCCFFLLLLTWWHWGEEEWIYERWKGGEVSPFFGFVRGGYPMLLPLVAAPGAYIGVLDGALGLSGRNVPEAISAIFLSTDFRAALLTLVVLVTLGERWVHRKSPRRVAQTVETAGLFFLFLLLPPLFSIGLYFMFSHSLRHIRLMGARIGKPMAENGRIVWPTFYLWASPFTVVGILFVVAWFFRNPLELDELSAFIGSYLVILWALTWPHAILTHQIFSASNLRNR